MNEQYMPTTEEVRAKYRVPELFAGLTTREAGARFNRWLAEVRREAAEEAWERGVNDVCAAYAIVRTRGYVENPYRQERGKQ